MNQVIRKMIKDGEQAYYGKELNVVQIYRDPKVQTSYVCRVEDDNNWCFILNIDYGTTLEEAMFEDYIELKPNEKINSQMFGELKF